MSAIDVSTVPELVAACGDNAIKIIVLHSDLLNVPSLTLPPGKGLRGAKGREFSLTFEPDKDGVQLTSNNSLSDLELYASADRRAIWNAHTTEDLGTLRLTNVTTTGQVQILARDKVVRGHVEVDGLTVVSADTRALADRPSGYGVSALQGAFTLWNMQPAENVVLTANLRALAAGRAGAPVLGSGIFVSGFGENGGRLNIQRLETEAVYSDGGIPPGTADLISGGVFTAHGTFVDLVQNNGPVTTYGANDMALDNWGTVDRWMALDKVTTSGPSGIGFVNFGEIAALTAAAPIETHGEGARGFNVYAGSVLRAEFDRIVTHGNGAVGVQISQPVGDLSFIRGIETFGSKGKSLVKGVMQDLVATALSVKPGGAANRISVRGGLKTHGSGVPPLEQEGRVRSVQIEDGFWMEGSN